jgi:hypothetical protein
MRGYHGFQGRNRSGARKDRACPPVKYTGISDSLFSLSGCRASGDGRDCRFGLRGVSAVDIPPREGSPPARKWGRGGGEQGALSSFHIERQGARDDPCQRQSPTAAKCSARTSKAGASFMVETPMQVENAFHRREALFCSLRRIHAALGGQELRPDHVTEVERVEIVLFICRSTAASRQEQRGERRERVNKLG